MDAKSIGYKSVGEQDIHIVSKHQSADYLFSIKEKDAFNMKSSGGWHLNEGMEFSIRDKGTK